MPKPTSLSLKKMQRLLWLMGWVQIPLIGFVKPKLLQLDEDVVRVKIPLRRRSRNHLKSMYFGALAVGADVAAGIHAFYFAEQSGVKVSFAFKSVKGEFLQRAMTDVVFESKDGGIVKAAFDEALQTGERINKPVKVTAYNDMNEPVAEFELVISIKIK